VDNFILVGILSVLVLYYFSTMNIYKSIQKKAVEEKKMCEVTAKSLEELIPKYERQIQNSILTIGDSQESLQLAREDLQKVKVANNELQHRNALLQERVEELYASVGLI
jgi:hypothetical protein